MTGVEFLLLSLFGATLTGSIAFCWKNYQPPKSQDLS